MGEVKYRSRVRIVKKKGAHRHAFLPGHDGPVDFGVHSEVAEHYGVEPDVEHTTTLDYVVGAAAG